MNTTTAIFMIILGASLFGSAMAIILFRGMSSAPLVLMSMLGACGVIVKAHGFMALGNIQLLPHNMIPTLALFGFGMIVFWWGTREIDDDVESVHKFKVPGRFLTGSLGSFFLLLAGALSFMV